MILALPMEKGQRRRSTGSKGSNEIRNLEDMGPTRLAGLHNPWTRLLQNRYQRLSRYRLFKARVSTGDEELSTNRAIIVRTILRKEDNLTARIVQSQVQTLL